MIGKKSMLLSKVIHRTLYYNFSEIKGATKNLLKDEDDIVIDDKPITIHEVETKEEEKKSLELKKKESITKDITIEDIKR